MKKAVLSSVLLALCIMTLAQVPESFNYQVVVRDGSTNSPLTNQNVSFMMNILKGSSSGVSQYSELHSANTGALGIVNLVIGNGTDKTGSFTTIDWGADAYFLNVQVDKGDAIFIDMGTTQLLSVPYAMHSKSAETSADAVKLTGNQTISGIKTFIGTVTVPTPVSDNDAANKTYVDNVLKTLGLIPNNYSGTMTDIDGNTYKTVTIGTQTWMSENLRVGRYKNGTTIPLVTDNTAWLNLTTPGYCWYNNDEAAYKATYGALYNWYTVNTGNLCPTGWHVPTDAEWTTLTTFLGGTSVAGSKLKETGTAHWASPNLGATNETGFTALPGGYRYLDGTFSYLGYYCYWWSAMEYDATSAWGRRLLYGSIFETRNSYYKEYGFSVRCVRD